MESINKGHRTSNFVYSREIVLSLVMGSEHLGLSFVGSFIRRVLYRSLQLYKYLSGLPSDAAEFYEQLLCLRDPHSEILSTSPQCLQQNSPLPPAEPKPHGEAGSGSRIQLCGCGCEPCVGCIAIVG